MLRVVNHLTGDETNFESDDDFKKLLAADKNTKGSVKWHAERAQLPHYSIYDGDVLIGKVVNGKPQAIERTVDSRAIAEAGAVLEEKVSDLETQISDLHQRVGELVQRVATLEAAKPQS